ncbi:putative membrane protein YeiH [Bradyrhizobium sp. F1.4.3]|uniref:trimeric intracellular cation channel family protein n=1 Tax=Bradyrhizobium sp. F1.4.3 TaxID=3156356 RepID=UPI00339B416C
MWSLPSDSALYYLSLIALAAQGMSAALAAGRRNMDWLGVCFLGCITALGGGTLRDLLLGHYPLVWVEKPIYLVLSGGAAFLTIIFARLVYRLRVAFIVLDAIGLVVFTMTGCDVAWQMDASLPIVIVSGMVTGCAGGVLRDVLCNVVPLLFRSELYATVSVVTGLFYATAFGLQINAQVWTILTFVLGISLRLLAVHYKWEMPKFDFTGDERPGPPS